MKVIDLLNKIANGEEVPKRIRFKDEEYTLGYGNTYKDEKSKFLLGGRYNNLILNDEVEILDEEDEFIDIEELDGSIGYLNWDSEAVVLTNAINDLIKNQKKIIEMLNNERN